MFFLSPGSLHKSSEVRDIQQREHQNLLCHMISSHCSGHVPGATKLHSHKTIPCFLMGICAFASTVCNNSYVFALKTCNVNASFKYRMHLGLVKGEVGSPGHSYCLGISRRDALLIHASPGSGFDAKSISPRVSRYLQRQLHSCSHAKIRWNIFFPHLSGWYGTSVGPRKSSPTFCQPSLGKFATAYGGQAFLWVMTIRTTPAVMIQRCMPALNRHNQMVLLSNNRQKPLQ